jgi:hypothetical protein
MARTCAVCRHPNRDAIEQAVLSGKSLRDTARQFGTPQHPVSKDAVQRHRPHMAELIAVAAERQISHGDDLATQVRELIARARMLGEKAEQAADLRGAVMAVREMGRLLELTARLTGELDQSAKHLHVHLPSREDGVATAQELLLACLERDEMAAFVERLRDRLSEPDLLTSPPTALLAGGNAEDRESRAPYNGQGSVLESSG